MAVLCVPWTAGALLEALGAAVRMQRAFLLVVWVGHLLGGLPATLLSLARVRWVLLPPGWRWVYWSECGDLCEWWSVWLGGGL